MFNQIIVIRGAGDLASGIGYRLYKSGFQKLIFLESSQPTMIRRTVSFGEAIYSKEVSIEGIRAFKVDKIEEIYDVWDKNNIPVMIDPSCSIRDKMNIDVIIDAIIAKKNLGTYKKMAPITIGVGPGFQAGVDVDAVVETSRGHDLGRVIYNGYAKPNTGLPGVIGGYSIERVLKSPSEGKINNLSDIGDMVKKGQTIATVNGQTITAEIDGVLRGIITNEFLVTKGLKVGDIDPRGIREHCFSISDKARSIGGGVLEALLSLYNRKERGVSHGR